MLISLSPGFFSSILLQRNSIAARLLTGLIFVVSALAVSAQYNAQYAEPINHGGFYIGPRVGIPFVLGVRGRYVAANDEKPVFYVDGEAATSVFINTLSIGGGIYPLGSTLYIGGKYHLLSTPLVNDPGASSGLLSMELGAAIALGEQRNWLILIDAGPILNPIADQLNAVTEGGYVKVLPNVTLSLVVRLF